MNKRTKSERRHTLHDRANLSHLCFPCGKSNIDRHASDSSMLETRIRVWGGGGGRGASETEVATEEGVCTVVGVSLLPNTTKSATWWNSILQNNTIDTSHVW
jgi:hypothetical protein